MTKTALRPSASPLPFVTDNPPTTAASSFNPDPRTAQQNKVAIHASQTDRLARRAADNLAMADYWHKAKTVVGGIEAMKKERETYFPRFVEEESQTYQGRLELTKMTNVYDDILESLASKPFEQEAHLIEDEGKSVPEQLLEFVENVDGAGNNLTMFGNQVFYNGVNNAIDWIFIDAPKIDPTTVRNNADAKRAGIRPYWSRVVAENVLEATATVIGGNETLTYIRIMEPGTPNHIREFVRNESGVIEWRLYVETNQYDTVLETAYEKIDEGTLEIDQIPLVPFMTGRRKGRTFVFKPPLKSALDLQVELFLQESGLKYTKHLAAYPMLTGNGVKPKYAADGVTIVPVRVGPGRVLFAPPDNAGKAGSWEFIQPNAEVLKFLADDIKSTQDQMRELGRQPLTAQSGNLTVITTAVAASKSRSAVVAWALSLKDALENAFVITCKFYGIATDTFDPQVFVFTDFDEIEDNAPAVQAIQTMRNDGDISQETYWGEMKRYGILSPEFNADTERKNLLEELPGDGEDNNGNPDAV